MVQSKIFDVSHSCGDDDQDFDDLTTVSDQSVLIPKEEAAVQSWEELRKVHVTVSHFNSLYMYL